MDSLIVIGIIAVLLLVISPIVSVISFSRSQRHEKRINILNQRIEQLEKQVKSNSKPISSDNIVVESASMSTQSVVAKSESITITDSPKTMAEAPTHSLSAAPTASLSLFTTMSVQADSSESPAQSEVVNKQVFKSAESPIIDHELDKQQLPGVLSSMIQWFLKGNPLAKLGIMLLFFGLVYLMKYSIDRELLSIELRLTIAAGISLGLLGVGIWLRHKQLLYALILQGGAIGALYLTIFGAFRLTTLVPETLAFALMIVICAASIGLAVMQKALSLAMLASIGGYLSPILLSTGGGSHVGLFSYYLMLSIGILAISIWQPWRILNLLGFFFTFSVAGLWGNQYYLPDYYLSCQLFLIANIAIFGVFSLGLSLRQQIKGKEVVDGVLLFGPPLLGFGMQYVITEQWYLGTAFSALGFGVTYLLLALASLRRYPGFGTRMATSGLALGLAFITLAIPLALSAQWTAMAWSLEGVGIVWVGLSQQQKRMSWSGSAILVLALISMFSVLINDNATLLALVLIMLVVILSYLAAGAFWHYYRPEKSFWQLISRYFVVVAIAVWLVWLWQIDDLIMIHLLNTFVAVYLPIYIPALPILLMCLSVVIWSLLGRRLAWPDLSMAVWLLWPFMLLFSYYFYSSLHFIPVLEQFEWLVCWIVVAGIGYWLLKRESHLIDNLVIKQGLHLSLYWGLIAGLLSFANCLVDYTHQLLWGMTEWVDGFFNVLIACIVLVSSTIFRRENSWLNAYPQYQQLYLSIGLIPIVALLLIRTLILNSLDGVMIGWGYIPLVNLLDQSVLLALFTFASWFFYNPQYSRLVKQCCYVVLALVGFYWFNGLILRTLSYYGDIRWSIDYLWSSRLVQTTFALVWTLVALISMVISTKYHHRKTWLTGSLLLGLTITKLFLVDSATGGGLARAIAFIGVAILVLIVGYFAPLPPKKERENNEDLAV